MKKNLFILLLSFLSLPVCAQQLLPIATNLKAAYQKQTRSFSGKPGIKYWQNKADYHIKVSFDPASRLVSGEVTIDYQNNSPDTLKQLVFKLSPNLYQQQSMRNTPIAEEDLGNGVNVGNVKVNDKPFASNQQKIRGTNMFLNGIEILPHTNIKVALSFSYTLNKGSFIRTGQVDSGAFVIAYFFPRIAVYDDMDGWNVYPYAGKEEFYNDYGNFKAEITLPANYQCWATGELTNPTEVYEQAYADRIKKASTSNEMVDIITPADLKKGQITKPDKQRTWGYEAENVTDFAFMVSNHYVWKSSSVEVDPVRKKRTRVDVVFNPDHPAYLPVIGYARRAIKLISFKFPAVPFPFNHQTIFEGLDAMEYPMMVNNLPFEGNQAVEFTVHEIFHALFPFFVGNNETKYSFLDEGWATYAELTLAANINPDLAGKYDISDFENSAGSEQDVPVMTLTPQLYGKARFSNKDLKPALAFLYLQEMLGDSLFRRGIRAYINEWQGKHPSPYDFFACMNTGTSKDLNWYWQNWFFEKQVPDLAISKVSIKSKRCNLTIKNLGGAYVPVHLQFSFTDGTQKLVKLSSKCWRKGNSLVNIAIPIKKRIAKIRLGTAYDADANRSNNIWSF